MKLLPPIIALIIVVLLANSAFIVKEGQSALLLQFGRIEGADANDTSDYKPGLHFKMPIVQHVVRYDRLILNLDAQVTVPFGHFTGVLATEDTNPLDHSVEHKFYGKDVGPLQTLDVGGKGREVLLSYSPGT